MKVTEPGFIPVRAISVKIHGKQLTYRMKIYHELTPKCLYLIYRAMKEEDKLEYAYPVKQYFTLGSWKYYRADIPLDEVAFKPNFWDFRLAVAMPQELIERDQRILHAKLFEAKSQLTLLQNRSAILLQRMENEAEVSAEIMKAQKRIAELSVPVDYSDERNCEKRYNIKNKSYFYYYRYCRLFVNNQYDTAGGMFAYPYVTVARDTALQFRQKGNYDDFHFRLQERLAMLRYVCTCHYLKKKNILLVYEKFCAMAQDNGYYFFKYCMDHKMEEKMGYHIYYVITRDSMDRGKLEPYEDHVIDYMSTKHICYAMAAKLYVSTETKMHIYPLRRKGSMLFHFTKRAKNLFLQHGVLGLKRVEDDLGRGKRGGADAFLTSGEYEKKIVLRYLEYSEKEIVNTGLARWDALVDKSDTCREILVMPTWRDWLDDATDDIFMESDYYKYYASLLQSQRLATILEKNDLVMNFYLHPKFKDYIGNFQTTSNRIHLVVFGEEPLNEMIMRCKLLITDYSSVCWDAYYMYKPVMFFQFDTQDYLAVRGAYMDLEKDLFGPNAKTVEDLLDYLEQEIANGFVLAEEYVARHKDYYVYEDSQHCARICDYILKRKW